MNKYIFVNNNENNKVTVTDLDTGKSVVLDIKEVPNIQLDYFDIHEMKYTGDTMSVTSSDGTLAFEDEELEIYGVLFKAGKVHKVVFVKFKDFNRFKREYKICNLEKKVIKDIRGVWAYIGIKKEKEERLCSKAPLWYYDGANMRMDAKNFISEVVNNYKLLTTGENGEKLEKVTALEVDYEGNLSEVVKYVHKHTKKDEVYENNDSQQILNMKDEDINLLNRLDELENIRIELKKHEEELNKMEEKIEERKRELIAREKNLNNREKNLNNIQNDLVKKQAILERKERALDSSNYILRLREQLEERISIINQKICDLDTICAYNIADMIIDVKNIFKLSSAETHIEKHIEKDSLLPDYVYEMILKLMRAGDCITVPCEYFGKLVVNKLRYLEHNANDTVYSALEQIKFSTNTEENIIAIIEFNSNIGAQIIICQAYGINNINKQDIAYYTVKYGENRLKLSNR